MSTHVSKLCAQPLSYCNSAVRIVHVSKQARLNDRVREIKEVAYVKLYSQVHICPHSHNKDIIIITHVMQCYITIIILFYVQD